MDLLLCCCWIPGIDFLRLFSDLLEALLPVVLWSLVDIWLLDPGVCFTSCRLCLQCHDISWVLIMLINILTTMMNPRTWMLCICCRGWVTQIGGKYSSKHNVPPHMWEGKGEGIWIIRKFLENFILTLISYGYTDLHRVLEIYFFFMYLNLFMQDYGTTWNTISGAVCRLDIYMT